MAIVITVEGPDGVRILEPEDGDVLVGRDVQCEIILSEQDVSRKHVRLRFSGEGVHFEDLHSLKGTYLVEADGTERRVEQGMLRVGQRLRVTQWTLRYQVGARGRPVSIVG